MGIMVGVLIKKNFIQINDLFFKSLKSELDFILSDKLNLIIITKLKVG